MPFAGGGSHWSLGGRRFRGPGYGGPGHRGTGRWGLRRRLTVMFVLVALGAVGLTTWLTLGAAFTAQREVARVLLELPNGRTVELPPEFGRFLEDRQRFWQQWPFDGRGPGRDPFGSPEDRFSPAKNALRNLTSNAFLAALLAFGLASVAAALMTRRITQPLNALADGVRRFAAGERGVRLPTPRNRDEIAEVTVAFNNLTSGLERQEAWRKALVADIAHDLRTPLAVLRSEIESMQDGVTSLDGRGLERLHGEVMMLSKLVDDLRTLSLAEGGGLSLNLQVTPLEPFLRALVERFTPRAVAGGVFVGLEPAPLSLRAKLDEVQFSRVLNNLLENAVRHAGPGRVEVSAAADGEFVRIRVRDHGPGFKPENLERAFERFYQGDASRTRDANRAKGSGLGLAIARAIVEAHGGRVEAENHPDGGAVFTIRLPSA